MLLTKAVSGFVIAGMFVSSANATIITVNSFLEFMGNPPSTRIVKMALGDNLMIDDGVTVESVGLDDTWWHFGFVDYDGGDTFVVGFAENSLKFIPGREGFMTGQYSSDLNFDDDLRPDGIWVIHDILGDGIGTIDTATGVWDKGIDDVFYDDGDILFGPGQVRGDVSQLPAWDGPSGNLILPPMTISVLPDPITGDLDGDGFVGITDLNIVLGNWNQNVPPADTAADPSGDGFIGIEDLNIVLGNWNTGTPPEAGTVIPEPGVGLLMIGVIPWLMRRYRHAY